MGKIIRLDGTPVPDPDAALDFGTDEAVRVFVETVKAAFGKLPGEQRGSLRSAVFYATGFLAGLDSAYELAFCEVTPVIVGTTAEINDVAAAEAGVFLGRKFGATAFDHVIAQLMGAANGGANGNGDGGHAQAQKGPDNPPAA